MRGCGRESYKWVHGLVLGAPLPVCSGQLSELAAVVSRKSPAAPLKPQLPRAPQLSTSTSGWGRAAPWCLCVCVCVCVRLRSVEVPYLGDFSRLVCTDGIRQVFSFLPRSLLLDSLALVFLIGTVVLLPNATCSTPAFCSTVE